MKICTGKITQKDRKDCFNACVEPVESIKDY